MAREEVSTSRTAAGSRLQRQDTLYHYIRSLPNLVAYYPLNETSGNAINHAPATQGTLDGTVTGATQGSDGLVGKAYSFDGVNDIITIDNDLVFQGDAYTVFVVFKSTDTVQFMNLIEKEQAWGLFIYEGILISFDWNMGIISTLVNVANGQWHLATLVYQSGISNGSYIYLDGILKKTFSTSEQTQNIGVTIGDRIGSSHDYTGLSQHIFICDAVLSSSQIIKLSQITGLA